MSDRDRSPRIALSRVRAWWRRHDPWASTGLAVVLAVASRLLFLDVTVYPDEGGYLLVARQLHSGGPFMYGNFFVDRPPLLLALYRLADALGGIHSLRLIATLLVVVMIAAASWAGWMIGSSRGARWAAFVAAALAASPLLGTAEADGEILAAPLILLGCTLVLAAVRRTGPPTRQVWYAAFAGIASMAALLVKQNFVEGFVFSIVLLTASAASKDLSRPAAARLLRAYAGGAAIPALAAAVWAVVWGTGLGDLWFAMYGLRLRALEVIQSQSLTPQSRLTALFVLALESGMGTLGAVYLVAQRRALRRLDPLVVAVTVMLAVAVTGIALGASYWSHYLIELVPALILASASLATSVGRTVGWGRAAVAIVVVSAIVSVSVTSASTQQPSQTVLLESWLHSAGRPTDSLFTYGHANLIEASGLRPSAYPYLWGLLMLVLDPDWTQLSATLNGPHAPTWVVEWNGSAAFGTGDVANLRAALAAHYRLVENLCGSPIYLLDGAQRSLPVLTLPCPQ